MATVRIYNFNNYYNRKYRVKDALEDYGTPIYTETGTNVNFNPNDGVNTQYTAGRQNNPYSGVGDYLIYSEENTDITSRWFIIEQDRNRLGQYALILRRDVLADNPSWMEAPTFIEKCTLSPYSPFIYNSEDMSFNEIKTKQTPIYDETGIPWIVGFYTTNNPGKVTYNPQARYDIALSGTSADFKTNIENKTYWKDAIYYYSYTQTTIIGPGAYNGVNVLTGETRYDNFSPKPGGTNLFNSNLVIKVDSSKFNKNDMDEMFKAFYVSNYDFSSVENEYTNKIIKFDDGYYTVTIIKETPQSEVNLSPAVNTAPWVYFNDRVGHTNLTLMGHTTQLNEYAIRVVPTLVKYTLQMNKVFPAGGAPITFNLDNSAVSPSSMPYRAFALPYGACSLIGYSTAADGLEHSVIADCSPDTMFELANYLNSDNVAGFTLIDCQLVPYCPVKDITITQVVGGISAIECDNKKVAFPIKQGDTTIGFIYSLNSCEKTFDVDLPTPITIKDYKLENQTDKYRLCAGNYTSAFDLNVAKNGGLTGYNISFTYKPFNSYVKVTPKFSGLYGSNFKDGRGLICSGMSLAKANDAFNQYRLQNKYYQDIFNRQIQNIEVQNKYQRIQQAIGAGVSVLGAGATVGILTGNVGAGIGAGVLSGVGGIADYQITKALQNEALDYTKDNFGYQLQNIKAQPDTLSRTADYNIDIQYVPFLEYYTCTNEEKDAFIEKLRFNGMTAMFIGIPEKYTSNTYTFKGPQKDYEDLGYFKGVPIRLEDISDDYHMTTAIAEELNKGVYMK